MYVRIARFEGGDPGGLDQMIEGIREELQGPPPAGLEGAKRVVVLIDRESGGGAGMTFFDPEEDMQRGHEALDAMSPSGGSRRTGVEMYEVGLDETLG